MSEKRELVLHAPIGRALWSLSWPLAMANELSVLHLSILIFWLDRLLGESGLAVESLLRPVELMLNWLFASASIGGSVLIGRSVGARDGRAMSFAAASVTLTGLGWVILVLIAAPLSPIIARLVAGDLPMAGGVLRFFLPWLLLAFPMVCIGELLLDVASATGWTRMGLTRVVRDLAAIALLMPIAVDTLGLGIAGVPIAVGVGTAILVGVLGWAMHQRRHQFGLGDLERGAWRPAWSTWKEILKIGLPVSASRVVTFAVQIGMVQFAARGGAADAVGYGIAVAIVLYGGNLGLALSQGAGVIMAQGLGAEMPERARSALRAGLVGSVLLATAFQVVLLADKWIIRFFTTDAHIAARSELALSTMRWGLYGLAAWQVLVASFAALKLSMRASGLTVVAEVAGLVFAIVWPGESPLETVALAFCVASGLKMLLLLAAARWSGLLTGSGAAAQLAP
jgi:Na+-driven multidrug efflux pump